MDAVASPTKPATTTRRPVETAQHMVHLSPVDTPTQQAFGPHAARQPEPGPQPDHRRVRQPANVFLAADAAHDTAGWWPSARCEPPPRRPRQRLAGKRAQPLPLSAGAAVGRRGEFLFASPHVPRDEAFAAYAAPASHPAAGCSTPRSDLMTRIHTDLIYEITEHRGQHAGARGAGPGQGRLPGLRPHHDRLPARLGLPARYVSGYLLTQPPPGKPRLVGSDASHAWVAVYLPDLPGAQEGRGWYDLDPTNDRCGWGTPGEDYVTLALGRDYSDISPMRGVIHGGARHTLSVAVTVEPIDEFTQRLDGIEPVSHQAKDDPAGQGLTLAPLASMPPLPPLKPLPDLPDEHQRQTQGL